ncbi:MAG: type II toxin-antitoxin system HicA family toxin [Candidatus Spechtbacterales bacterium]
MPKLPQIKPTTLLRALQRAGFFIDHVTGSHYIFYKDDKSTPISVPRHNKDLKLGTLRSILRQAKMSVKELIEYL